MKTVLITDFDNTLYDWFHMWTVSFNAMLAEIEKISGLDRSVLIPEIRAVHQRYGTSEYAFLVQQLPSLQRLYPRQLELLERFDPAIHAYRSARKATLSLYAGVAGTLRALRARDVLIVLYTDSLAFYTMDRIKRLGLDDLVDYVYSPPDHEVPEGIESYAGNEKSRLTHAEHRFLQKGAAKPSPDVLKDVIAGIGSTAEQCIYLGDSLTRDVAMAQDAGVEDVLAEYGAVQNRPEYELLRQVSHWRETAVHSEKITTTRDIRPTHVVSSFPKVIEFFGG